jgi:hypothetical protein
MERKTRLLRKMLFWAAAFLVISLARHYGELREVTAWLVVGLGVIDSFWEQYRCA